MLNKKKKQIFSIIKICLFIFIFNIVIRCELWVSLAGLVIIMPYLLSQLISNKVDLLKIVNTFHQVVLIFKNTKTDNVTSRNVNTDSTLFNFVEPSFEDIWRDCSQVDFVWSEQDYQSLHIEETNCEL